MGFFRKRKRSNDINAIASEIHKHGNAILVDVRSPEEYAKGHIPGAYNVDAKEIHKIERIVHDKGTKIFLYCLRGSRSRSAARRLAKMGYTNVKDIGGIRQYKGELER